MFLVEAALRHRIVAVLLAGLLAVVGFRAFRDLPIDAFPDVTNIQVTIISHGATLSPLETCGDEPISRCLPRSLIPEPSAFEPSSSPAESAARAECVPDTRTSRRRTRSSPSDVVPRPCV